MGDMKTLSEVKDLLVGPGYPFDFHIKDDKM